MVAEGTHHEVGVRQARAPACRETDDARLGDRVDVLTEEDLNAPRAHAALDVFPELVRVRRVQELLVAMYDRDLRILRRADHRQMRMRTARSMQGNHGAAREGLQDRHP